MSSESAVYSNPTPTDVTVGYGLPEGLNPECYPAFEWLSNTLSNRGDTVLWDDLSGVFNLEGMSDRERTAFAMLLSAYGNRCIRCSYQGYSYAVARLGEAEIRASKMERVISEQRESLSYNGHWTVALMNRLLLRIDRLCKQAMDYRRRHVVFCRLVKGVERGDYANERRLEFASMLYSVDASQRLHVTGLIKKKACNELSKIPTDRRRLFLP